MESTQDQAPAEEQIRVLIDQLSFLVDELEGQFVLIRRIPGSLLTDRPYAEVPSIRDLYLRFRERTRGLNQSVIRGLIDGSAVGQDIESLDIPVEDLAVDNTGVIEIIEDIITIRQHSVAMLELIEPAIWIRSVIRDNQPVSLYEWVYEIALRDADDLREIAVQFYERKITFRSGT